MTGPQSFLLAITLMPLAWRAWRAWRQARDPEQVPRAVYWLVLVVGAAGAFWATWGIFLESDGTALQGWAVELPALGLLWMTHAGAKRSGATMLKETVLRGSRVIDAPAKGKRPKAGKRPDISIGGVEIPRELEAQHFLISGTTGTGKTQAINAMLRTIRDRGERAIIADPGGGFFSRFAQPGDVLLNPFDQRGEAWSPFAEIRADYDCDRIAKAIVPDGHGDGAEWHHYAQGLVAAVLRKMHRYSDRSTEKLLWWLTTADARELGTLLEGTPAAALCAKGNDRMLASTRGVLSSYLGVFPYLPDTGDFSVRQWVQDDDRPGWLFVTYRDDQMGLLRGLVATMIELAIVEGLSLTESQERGLWFVADEVDSLGKVTSLRAGLTKLRKYGGRCVLGLQTVSQLRTTYGRDEAQTLLANCSTKLILRAGDAETAKAMEDELGYQEVERVIGGTSANSPSIFSGQWSSKGTSESATVARQAAVMASELMALPNLQGFLKMPGDAIHRVALDYTGMPQVEPTFQPK